jgi:hypothetical protein
MNDFAIRGVEMHSNNRFQTGSWRWKSIDRVLGIMERNELNALIFHQVDLTDWLVLPSAYFTPEAMRSRWPARLAQVENARSHIREVVRRAAGKGIGFYLEVKEMWYPDELIALHPEVMVVKGIVCPTHPFWWEFIRTKYAELVEEVPGIAGVIMSPRARGAARTIRRPGMRTSSARRASRWRRGARSWRSGTSPSAAPTRISS